MAKPIGGNDGPATTTSMASDDTFVIWRKTNSDVRTITKANAFSGYVTGDGTISGGGTIATGGYTGTLPATGTVALKTGTPVAGRLASWANAYTLQDAGYSAADIPLLTAIQTWTAAQTYSAMITANGGITLPSAGATLPGTGNEALRLYDTITAAANTTDYTLAAIGQRGALVLAEGINGSSHFFCDLLLFTRSGQVSTVGSSQGGGIAATRTYTVSGTNLLIKLSSGSPWTVRALSVARLGDPS